MSMTYRGRNWDMGVVGLSVLTAMLALFFWNSVLLLPIKLFVVLLHEISHGLAALLTGGTIERLILTSDEGGLAFTRGGSRFLILSAGYMGSALWGAILLRLAWAAPSIRRTALRWMAIALAVVALLYVRSLFTLAFVAFSTLIIFWLSRMGGNRTQMAALWVMGTISCLYALIDIGSDILSAGLFAGIPLLGGPARLTDAQMLADITFIPSFVWGLIWSAISVAIYMGAVATLAIRRGR